MDRETRVSKLLREARSHAAAPPQLHRPETPADVGRQLQSRTGSRGALRRLSVGVSGGFGDLSSPASLHQVSSGGSSFSAPPPRKLDPLHPAPPSRETTPTSTPLCDSPPSSPGSEGESSSGGHLAQYEQILCQFAANTSGGTSATPTESEVKVCLRALESSASKLKLGGGASADLLQALHQITVHTPGGGGSDGLLRSSSMSGAARINTPPTEEGVRGGSSPLDKPTNLQVQAAVLLSKILPVPPPSAVRVLTHAMKYGEQSTNNGGNDSREGSPESSNTALTGLLRSKRLLDPFIQILRSESGSSNNVVPPEDSTSTATGNLMSQMNLLTCVKVAVTKDEDSRKVAISSGVVLMLVAVMSREAPAVQSLVTARNGGVSGGKRDSSISTHQDSSCSSFLLPIFFDMAQSILEILRAILKSEGHHQLLKFGVLRPMVLFLTPALGISPITPGKEEKHPLNSYARLLSKLVGKEEGSAVQEFCGGLRPATPPPAGTVKRREDVLQRVTSVASEQSNTVADSQPAVTAVLEQLIGTIITFHSFPLVVSQLGYVVAVVLGGGTSAEEEEIPQRSPSEVLASDCTGDLLALVLVASELAKQLQVDLTSLNTTGTLVNTGSSATAMSQAEKLGWLRVKVDSLTCLSRILSNTSLGPQGGALLVQRTAVVDKFLMIVLDAALAGVVQGSSGTYEENNATIGATVSEEGEAAKLEISLSQLGLESVLCLANLSYYFNVAFTPSNVKENPIDEEDAAAVSDQDDAMMMYSLTLDLLSPLLMASLLHETNADYVSAAARCLGNVSASTLGRRWLVNSRLDEAILLLLRHEDWRVVFSCVGCLVNLTGDHQQPAQGEVGEVEGNPYSAIASPNSEDGEVKREALTSALSLLSERLSGYLEVTNEEEENGMGVSTTRATVETVVELQRVIRTNLLLGN